MLTFKKAIDSGVAYKGADSSPVVHITHKFAINDIITLVQMGMEAWPSFCEKLMYEVPKLKEETSALQASLRYAEQQVIVHKRNSQNKDAQIKELNAQLNVQSAYKESLASTKDVLRIKETQVDELVDIIEARNHEITQLKTQLNAAKTPPLQNGGFMCIAARGERPPKYVHLNSDSALQEAKRLAGFAGTVQVVKCIFAVDSQGEIHEAGWSLSKG